MKKKRILALFLAAVSCLSLAVSASAAGTTTRKATDFKDYDRTAWYPDTFISSNNKLNEQLRRMKQEKARLLDTDSDDLADRTRDLMDALEDGPDFLDSFDAELFDALVEKIIVDSNERLRFQLKNGLELLEQIERTRR